MRFLLGNNYRKLTSDTFLSSVFFSTLCSFSSTLNIGIATDSKLRASEPNIIEIPWLLLPGSESGTEQIAVHVLSHWSNLDRTVCFP